MKIVINNCFGGFGLSMKGEKLYAKLKGFELFFYKQTKYKHSHGEDEYVKIVEESSKNFLFMSALKVDLGEKTNKLTYKDGEYFSCSDISRTDKDLIKVVETLGSKANGQCAELQIIEIPDGIEWEIDEYDGNETIDEVHRSWR